MGGEEKSDPAPIMKILSKLGLEHFMHFILVLLSRMLLVPMTLLLLLSVETFSFKTIPLCHLRELRTPVRKIENP